MSTIVVVCPANRLDLLAWLTVDVHGYLDFHRVLLIVVTKMRLHKWNLITLEA
ncbi:hypothetical protein SDC9_128573 [bioreactor metagenome]|uniref:Uncharacterized protein n=1 Tax=bioreactor metagenome TaxID=1076179 RepID=A0A645CWI1_9ZZZZ